MFDLVKFFQNEVKYFVVKDDGYGEKQLWHDRFPYPHLIIVANLKSASAKNQVKHKVSLNFSSEEYKAFLVNPQDDVQAVLEGLLLYAGVHNKLPKAEFEKVKYEAYKHLVKGVQGAIFSAEDELRNKIVLH
jgi:hypothetical protein